MNQAFGFGGDWPCNGPLQYNRTRDPTLQICISICFERTRTQAGGLETYPSVRAGIGRLSWQRLPIALQCGRAAQGLLQPASLLPANIINKTRTKTLRLRVKSNYRRARESASSSDIFCLRRVCFSAAEAANSRSASLLGACNVGRPLCFGTF